MKVVSCGLLAAVAVSMLGSCAAVMRTHGYTPIPEALARIEPGVDTRASVQTKIGRPSHTGVVDERGWYYVSSTVEHFTFYEPEVVERKVVAVTFDETDLVEAVNIYGLEDGRVINLATDTTPTYGRQLTIVEQIIGNIGNVTGSDIFGDE
ncbi:MAG: outer membrane protein assembly factor BamE [Pikeienuella sp.]